MTFSDISKRKSEKLTELGRQHLKDGDAEAALKVAAELETLRYTAAFEIAALAHAQLGDLEAGVAVLRRGLELAPGVWINWQLLGNQLSDLERYAEAAAAYEKALECPESWHSSVRLNQAILALRRGLHGEALAYADQVTDAELAVRAASPRVTALVRLGRIDEAVESGDAMLAKSGAEASEDELGYLAGAVGRARMARGATTDEILAFALEALEVCGQSNFQVLALIRDADNQYSSAAKYFRMSIDAKIPIADALAELGRGYMVNYDVVADSIEEALTFVERMEEPAVRGNLLVGEHQALEDRPDEPKGVYSRTERYYYERED